MKSIVCIDHVSPNYISASRLFMALYQAVAREKFQNLIVGNCRREQIRCLVGYRCYGNSASLAIFCSYHIQLSSKMVAMFVPDH